MDGKTMLKTLEGILNEEGCSPILDTFFSFEVLDKAASDYLRETKGIARTETLTTLLDTQEYSLPPDFLGLRIRDNQHRNVMRYYDNVNALYHWPYLKSYDYLYLANRANITGSQNTPDYFAITDTDIEVQITGNAASGSGTLVGGECTLKGATAAFSDVHARDRVHDTTESYYGIVLEVEASNSLKVALFNDGEPVATASGNAFLIQPAAHAKIVLSDPSEVEGHTMDILYYGMQNPVYSDYRIWSFPPTACAGICKKAAFEYKYKDRQPDFGDRLYVDYLREVSQRKRDIAKTILQGRYGRGFS